MKRHQQIPILLRMAFIKNMIYLELITSILHYYTTHLLIYETNSQMQQILQIVVQSATRKHVKYKNNRK